MHTVLKITIIGLLYLLASTSTKADITHAISLYEAENYSEAFKEFKSLAEIGDKRSQYSLGVMYFMGQHVDRDITKAYAWIKLAKQGGTKTITNIEESFQLVESQVNDLSLAEEEFRELQTLYSTGALSRNLYPVLMKPVGKFDFEAQPLKIVEPKWPRKALQNGIQGWVKLSFNLDEKGRPRNIVVDESIPRKIFSRSALSAVEKWQFEIVKAEGDALKNKRLVYKMQYMLEGMENFKVRESIYNKTLERAEAGDPKAQLEIGFWGKTFREYRTNNPNSWLLKSSVQGHPMAQYLLGKSLVYGEGCIADKTKGIEWLIRSASSGQRYSKELLGIVAAENTDYESHLKAKEFFSELDEMSTYPKLRFAWLLATSNYKDISDPDLAIDLVESIKESEFNDPVTLYEIKAAAYAAKGNFSKAISNQEYALDEAENRQIDLTNVLKNLDLYRNNKSISIENI